MFPSSLGSQNIMQIERSLKKRNNMASASSASRFSPYPSSLCPFNAFPEQGNEVLKTFEDCYDCLHSNRGTVIARPSLPTESNQKSTIVSSSTVSDAVNSTHTSKDNNASLSYIAMIAMAILATPEARLNLAGIYSYMERHFSSTLRLRSGWRNTVRHNLSLHDCFVKGEIAAEGKGRFWRIHPYYLEQFKGGKFNKNVIRSALPVFYPNTANFHFSARPHIGSSPTISPLDASILPTSVSPMFPTSVSPMFPTSVPSMFPTSAMSPRFTTSPYQDFPSVYQHRPATCLRNRREYREFHMFPCQRCPPGFCNAYTHVRQSLPTLLCPSYETLALENGAMSYLES